MVISPLLLPWWTYANNTPSMATFPFLLLSPHDALISTTNNAYVNHTVIATTNEPHDGKVPHKNLLLLLLHSPYTLEGASPCSLIFFLITNVFSICSFCWMLEWYLLGGSINSYGITWSIAIPPQPIGRFLRCRCGCVSFWGIFVLCFMGKTGKYPYLGELGALTFEDPHWVCLDPRNHTSSVTHL